MSCAKYGLFKASILMNKLFVNYSTYALISLDELIVHNKKKHIDNC